MPTWRHPYISTKSYFRELSGYFTANFLSWLAVNNCLVSGGAFTLVMAVSLPLKAGEVDEGQAWQQLVRHGQTTDTTLLSVFLRGQFWDKPGSGQSFLSSNGQQFADGEARGARLLNIWL
mgnify:CR=1 FL=1